MAMPFRKEYELNVFEAVKDNVTMRQAAEMYGIKIGRNGMACCPFHKDKNPSMKVDKRFHCFGCQADGDVIDFAAHLFGLGKKDAAEKLATDFGIQIDQPKNAAKGRKKAQLKARADPQKEAEEWLNKAVKTLLDYLQLLRDFEQYDAPKSMNEDWDDHPLFCLALQQKSYIEYLLDELMNCSKDQFIEMQNSCGKEVEKIGKRLERYESGRKEKDGCAADGRCRAGGGRSSALVRREEGR